MQFTDLTTAIEKTYELNQSGKRMFFLHNISGDFTFEMNAPHTEAHIFALFTGKNSDTFTLTINQLHNAPDTSSHVTVQFLGRDNSSLDYKGLIRVEKNAVNSNASQKNTNLLLSDTVQAFSFPSLEILTDDVVCHHGSTTSRINRDHLFYAQSRGLSMIDAEHMLANGFIQNFFDEIEKLGQCEEIKKYKPLI